MPMDSHVLAENPAVDLAIAQAMAEELEEYIIKDDLYRTVIVKAPGGEVRVQMTGGDLLTRLRRLNGERARLTPQQQATLDAVAQSAERTIYSLKTRFYNRLQREMKARIDALRWFLDEAVDEAQRARANYPYEIRNRQRIEEIVQRLGSDLPDDLKGQLDEVDRRLRAITTGAEFIWDPALAGVFPQYPYWYLYARI